MKRKAEIIAVMITIPEDERGGRWQLYLIDHDTGDVLGSVCLNQAITRYLKTMIAMIEDELPEEG